MFKKINFKNSFKYQLFLPVTAFINIENHMVQILQLLYKLFVKNEFCSMNSVLTCNTIIKTNNLQRFSKPYHDHAVIINN